MITASFSFEKNLWNKGIKFICGVDEVGRGCFAGPIVAGAVVFPPNIKFPHALADSKLLSPEVRMEVSLKIQELALFWAVSEISTQAINKVGIGLAAQMAFRKAISNLGQIPEFIFIDAFYIKNKSRVNQLPLVKGDQVCASIAAASIVAKVYRDDLMDKLSQRYPNYNFAKNKGYGTLEHRQAIKQFGLSKQHRQSFDLAKYI